MISVFTLHTTEFRVQLQRFVNTSSDKDFFFGKVLFVIFNVILSNSCICGGTNRVLNNPGIAGTFGITFLIMPFLLF